VCGICGIVELGRAAQVETAAAMARELDHRGPDGAGAFDAPGVALGFRRLAILDLSEAGMQPFASEDGRHVLVHNGEIYNYRELRAELEGRGHRFRSATDTEVILAAYREWGERCVERFNGMWAFALWDDAERRLFCSRDRFGVKPFYYRHEGGRFAFASELKAFRGDPAFRAEANLPLVRDYVEHGTLEHTDETFFAGVRKLPPAHSLAVDGRGLRLWRYWQLALEPPPDDAHELVRSLFVDSVRLRLRSDVPVGTCLSGGLDSSAIACVVDHLMRTEAESTLPVGERQRTFTAYFEGAGYDERPYAEAVVERTRSSAHWVSFGSRDVLEVLPRVVETQDEPFGSTSIVAQWFVLREAAEAGLKVMLDGQGGDEVFAGYPVYVGSRLADLLLGAHLLELRSQVAAQRRVQGASRSAVAQALVRPLAPERLKRLVRARVKGTSGLVGPVLSEVDGGYEPPPSPFPDRLRRQMAAILAHGLPELLRYEDRNSMAHSLEARVPFLDYRLVQACFSVRPEQLLDAGVTKVLLRRSLRDLLPPLVRDRVDKIGFATPESRWLREDLGAFAAEVFASRSFADRGLFDVDAVRERLRAHREGRLEGAQGLWRVLNTELWARTFLDRPAPRPGAVAVAA
jgi:asparagine synthase (glutamine-hydrolysing)